MIPNHLWIHGVVLGVLMLACIRLPPVVAQTEPVPGAVVLPSAASDVFTNGYIPELHLEISPAALNILRKTETPWERRVVTPRPDALIKIRENQRVYTNVQVHLKGSLGSFRGIDDNPAFTVNFSKMATGQTFHGYSKIYLNNSVQDPSLLSELICREMFLNAGIPVPRASHAMVYLNGRRLGLYVMVEGWSRQFLKKHFKDYKGHLYDCGLARDIDAPLEKDLSETPQDRSDLDAVLQALGAGDGAARFEQLSRRLDLDEFRRFIAMEIMLCHWDGYAMNRNNYRIYSEAGTGKLHFLPHGMDQMFGTWRSSPESPITPRMNGMVARSVLQPRESRVRYLELMEELHQKVYRTEEWVSRLNEVGSRVLKTVAKFDPNESASRREAMRQLRDRIIERGASIKEQLLTARNFTTNSAPFPQTQLKNWNGRQEMGNVRLSQNGSGLTMEGNGTASWRTTLMLPPGDYVFSGRVKTENIRITRREPGDNKSGIGLRISGDRLERQIVTSQDWVETTFEFTVDYPSETVFVCDFKNITGKATFDLASLIVRRR